MQFSVDQIFHWVVNQKKPVAINISRLHSCSLVWMVFLPTTPPILDLELVLALPKHAPLSFYPLSSADLPATKSWFQGKAFYSTNPIPPLFPRNNQKNNPDTDRDYVHTVLVYPKVPEVR